MAEYIERETAIAWFMPYAHVGESIDADVVISDIKGMKAADVAPVRHGRWERTADGAALCTACKRKMNLSHYGCAFCSLCGAIMDGERKEDDHAEDHA